MDLINSLKRKGHYFTDSNIEKITYDAFKILENAGIKLKDDKIIAQLKGKGYSFSGNSALIPQKQALSYLVKLQNQTEIAELNESEETSPVKFKFALNGYCDNLEDHVTGEISRFDTEKLILTTKYCNAIIHEYGYSPSMPGIAHDVHPDLIPLMSCKIGAQYIEGGWDPDVYSIKIIPYMQEMCEVMGSSIEEAAIYMVNPLILAGESFQVALNLKDTIKKVKIRTLPTLGVSTPMDIPAALSLSLAEVLGAGIIVNELTGLPTDIAVSLFPFDFRELTVMYGSIEKQLLSFMAAELNTRLKIMTKRYASNKIDLTNLAKKSSFQSIMDNAQTITAGAMWGGRSFRSSGCLSCGEIFSPIQMVADLEMIERAKILVNGMNMNSGEDDILSKIKCEENKNFFESELSLFHHNEFIWYPKFHDRSPLGSWRAKGMPEIKDRISDYIENTRKNKCDYVLEKIKFNELDKIYTKAEQMLN